MKCTALIAAIVGLASALPNPLAPRQLNRVARRRAGASGFNRKNVTHPSYSTNWAGAVQIGHGFTKVVGTITVPQASGGDKAAASAWVGIDGDTCGTAILQTGIDFYGDGSFDAWYEWIPDGSYGFGDFDMAVGDQIRMTVEASSTTSGVATVENLSNGQRVSHSFRNPPSTLCETNAEWIVEDFEVDGGLVPFANFGTVTFTDARAEGSDGTVTPAGAEIFDIVADNNVITDCRTNGNDLVCDYIG
ncbi:peptidase A4 family protein [Purpureocillium lavendulum]|uniref:Peptidase A4 family protein n=1 Tax=Purpureocillium lavendulum TaxID=1247861 RepID=A0AB34FF50_9HYPO|nr:peptidase A4 family protein [Purpureocillium lavendulum]